MSKRRIRIDHDDVVKRFAQRLKQLRFERGMSQVDLARAAEVAETYLSKLENAGAAPGIDFVEKLAKALGTDASDLIPKPASMDSLSVPRDQAKKLFDSLMKTADHQTFSALNPYLVFLLESAEKRM